MLGQSMPTAALRNKKCRPAWAGAYSMVGSAAELQFLTRAASTDELSVLYRLDLQRAFGDAFVAVLGVDQLSVDIRVVELAEALQGVAQLLASDRTSHLV